MASGFWSFFGLFDEKVEAYNKKFDDDAHWQYDGMDEAEFIDAESQAVYDLDNGTFKGFATEEETVEEAEERERRFVEWICTMLRKKYRRPQLYYPSDLVFDMFPVAEQYSNTEELKIWWMSYKHPIGDAICQAAGLGECAHPIVYPTEWGTLLAVQHDELYKMIQWVVELCKQYGEEFVPDEEEEEEKDKKEEQLTQIIVEKEVEEDQRGHQANQSIDLKK
jgi:hypothetical protein